MHRIVISATLFVVGLFLNFAAHAYVGDSLHLPPHDGYREFETEHFKVVFPKTYEVEANDTAKVLEESHEYLTRAFANAPDHKTTVILTDSEDTANGATSAVGRQGLVLFLSAPEPGISISEYDDWLRMLVTHEYAHYLTLSQRRGLFAFARILFGDLFYPNHFWPSWLAEGMAVFAETKFSTRGRGFGALYSTLTRDAIYRGLFKKHSGRNFLDYDSLHGPIPDYPFGESYYYVGHAVVDQLVHDYGVKAPGRVAEAGSWRVPYFLDGTLESATEEFEDTPEKSFEALWERWIRRQTRAIAPELEALKNNPVFVGKMDTPIRVDRGVSIRAARVSPDGKKIAYIQQSGHERPAVFVYDRESQSSRKLDEAVTSSQLSWSSDGSRLLYSKLDFDGPYRFYSDLYETRVDLPLVTPTFRVTSGERARDPDVCMIDGKESIVFRTQTGRISELKIFRRDNEQVETLYRAPDYSRIANPRCDVSHQQVVFSEHSRMQWQESLKALDLKSRAVTTLFDGPAQGRGALFPEPTNNGIFFTEVSDTYFHLSFLDPPTQKVSRIGTSHFGFWMPSYHAGTNTLVATLVAADGLKTAVIRDVQISSNTKNAQITETLRPAYKRDPQNHELKDTVKSATSGYSVFSSLLPPRLWAPTLMWGESRSVFGAQAAGWDDTDQVQYSLALAYDSAPMFPVGSISTFHRVASFRVGFDARSRLAEYAGSPKSFLSYEQERSATFEVARPFLSTFSDWTPSFSIGWAQSYYGARFQTTRFRDVPGTPQLRLTAGLSYENRATFGYSIAPEKGLSFDLRARRYYAGYDESTKLLGSLQTIIPSPLPKHASLMLTGWGGYVIAPFTLVEETALRPGANGDQGSMNPPLRGYPIAAFDTKYSIVGQLEYRVPVFQLFRGNSHLPLFFNNIGIFGFGDVARIKILRSERLTTLTSTGGGLLFNGTLGYNFPLKLRLEFAHGFRRSDRGENTVALLTGI